MNLKERMYTEKTAGFLQTFLEKEGFCLLKTEFVKEDGIFYLRVYLDLTEAEKTRRKTAAEAEAADSGENGTEGQEPAEAAEEEKKEEKEEAAEEEENCKEPPEPGIGINDCAFVSRRLSKWLDQKDFIEEEYTLEVCSRGYLKPEQAGCPEEGRKEETGETEGEPQ